MTDIGIRIKEIRTKRELSQEELAELSKVNLRTIQRIENNETTPREKTLNLIFDALDIVVINPQKKKLDKYLIWASLLTLLIIISTFIGWISMFKMFRNGESIYRTSTGWKGNALFFDYDYPNWLLSISSISIGLIVIAHALGLLKNKFKYIVVQLTVLFLYILGVFNWSFIQGFDIKPGLFIIVVATILLVRAYLKKNRKIT